MYYYACRGNEFTNDKVNNTFKKDLAFFLHSKRIARSSNELSIELSINEVCSNVFQELKNIKLENAKNLLIGRLK